MGYRLTQSRESLDEAEYLLAGGKSLRGVANRLYYAMFYAVLALLVDEPFSSSKHSGVLSYFNRRFIKSGVFPNDMGLAINRAFGMRQRGDYKEHVELDSEEVNQLIGKTRMFIQNVESHIRDQGNL